MTNLLTTAKNTIHTTTLSVLFTLSVNAASLAETVTDHSVAPNSNIATDYRLVSTKKAMTDQMYQRLIALGINFPDNNDNNIPLFGRMPVTIIDDELYLAMVKNNGVDNDLVSRSIFYTTYNKVGVMRRNGRPYFAYQPEQIADNIRALVPQFANPNEADMLILAFAGNAPDDPNSIMKFIQRDDQHRPEGKAANEAANLLIVGTRLVG